MLPAQDGSQRITQCGGGVIGQFLDGPGDRPIRPNQQRITVGDIAQLRSGIERIIVDTPNADLFDDQVESEFFCNTVSGFSPGGIINTGQ